MKLHFIGDIPENSYYHCLSSKNGKVIMGVLPVMFGYRVVGYTKGGVGPSVNWCGGANQKDVERLYSLLKSILSHRNENDPNPFEGLPIASNIKPFYFDLDFIEKMGRLAGDFKVEPLPPMAEFRKKSLDFYNNRELVGAIGGLTDE